jgi:propanediol dehydratase small subunit
MRNSVPVIAYHCKLFAVQKGLDLCKQRPGEQATAAKSYLINELDDLTLMKKAMGDINKEDMQMTVENFVLSVFA